MGYVFPGLARDPDRRGRVVAVAMLVGLASACAHAINYYL